MHKSNGVGDMSVALRSSLYIKKIQLLLLKIYLYCDYGREVFDMLGVV